MKTIEQVKEFIQKNIKLEKDKKMPVQNDFESGVVHGKSIAYLKIQDYIYSEEYK